MIDEIHGHRVTDSPSPASAVATAADCPAAPGCRSSNHAAVHVHAAITVRIQIERDRRGTTVAHDTDSFLSPGAPDTLTVGNEAKTSIALVPPWAGFRGIAASGESTLEISRLEDSPARFRNMPEAPSRLS